MVCQSSSKFDDCGLVHVEDVGLLVLHVLGVLGVVLNELGGDTGCTCIFGVESPFGVTAVSGIMCGPLMTDRYDSISSFDGMNDDNGLVMRFFGIELFVADGIVMTVFALEYFTGDGLVMKVFFLLAMVL